MGRLKDFRRYLNGRRKVLQQIEDHLCELQGKYESFFAEVSAAREHELEQLIAHCLSDRSVLPGWFNEELDATQVEVEADLDARMEELARAGEEMRARGEEERRTSLEAEHRVRRLNLALDREEEDLKLRNADLLVRIAKFNERITEMGRGFGFFANFFRMRRIAAEKHELDAEQRDVRARIESLRARWQRQEGEHVNKEEERSASWVVAENEAAALSTKYEALRQTRPSLVIRSTVERVLAAKRRPDAEASDADPACSRCNVNNPPGNHFCHICAQRLGADREDFDGSLEEISEINRHFERFSDGMTACQQIIGLVRGMKSGVDAFMESVVDVEASEKKYPLPKLEIDVPEESVNFGVGFDRLLSMVERKYAVHPKVFADHVGLMIEEVFTEAAIQGYFEGMGAELSAQADAQWK